MQQTGKFKAVLFDLGGTIMKTVDVPEIHRRILEAHGINAPLDKIAEAHDANQREHDPEEMARIGQEYWVKWNLKMLQRLGIRENKEFLARKIDESWWKYSELAVHSDVKETLTQLLDRGIKTGIVTNGTERDIKQILQKLNLTSYFDVAVGVDTCKKAKPRKEIFLYALNKLNVKPEEAIFVGDSMKYDYEGAEKAGLKSILIDRDGKKPANVDTIRNLAELLTYV